MPSLSFCLSGWAWVAALDCWSVSVSQWWWSSLIMILLVVSVMRYLGGLVEYTFADWRNIPFSSLSLPLYLCCPAEDDREEEDSHRVSLFPDRSFSSPTDRLILLLVHLHNNRSRVSLCPYHPSLFGATANNRMLNCWMDDLMIIMRNDYGRICRRERKKGIRCIRLRFTPSRSHWITTEARRRGAI